MLSVFGGADLGMMLPSLRRSESFINMFTKRISPSSARTWALEVPEVKEIFEVHIGSRASWRQKDAPGPSSVLHSA